ncbi:Asparagine synthetase [glutamine-hydrolyzing] 1 [Synechococcus sp. MIT S9509]|uniref:asparagine synthase (glutamine-hydrolyzing) n=1 Tax=Synechococcus sp. MIT S9509 TaxID=1801630 RepID=UPI0007BBAF71|nr:asparagine synthase (glutamine-hydrolyzing) [Synechococcus sp. MIT S9509]KZR93747.1 Asparagine synthetase [glutamine-hydrolyzing] 1 [Synechococcus sp. MIT S9509]
MCGFSAFIQSLSYQKISDSNFYNKSSYFLEKRGPDAFGTHSLKTKHHHLGFYHSRLSIIDISNDGIQPMISKDKSLTIIFNGEIYNYREIRQELTLLGCQFFSHTDTEVLLNSWQVWGPSCLDKLNGMFSFAITDNVNKKIWLVRDRCGIKPLFWHSPDSKSFFYSSSSLLLHKIFCSSINLEFCAFGLSRKIFETDSSSSPYNDIHSVPPGSFLCIDFKNEDLTFKLSNWYDLKTKIVQNSIEYQSSELSDIFDQCVYLLSNSIDLRLRSDVKICTSLSGGLDSSLISSFVALSNNKLDVFTYGDPYDPDSEAFIASNTAKSLDAILHSVSFPARFDQLFDLYTSTLTNQESPFISLSILAQSLVFQKMKQSSYKVALGGQGADEVFAGYRKYFIAYLRESLDNRDYKNLLACFISLFKMLAAQSKYSSAYFQTLPKYFATKGNQALILKLPTQLHDPISVNNSLQIMQCKDITSLSLPTLLRYEDRNSMGHSIESRLPFLDYRLLEFGLSLDSSLKISNGYSKYILRKAFSSHIPSKIRRTRSKRGFNTDTRLVRQGIGSVLRQIILSTPRSTYSHIVSPDYERYLSDEYIGSSSTALEEAMMLAWYCHTSLI